MQPALPAKLETRLQKDYQDLNSPPFPPLTITKNPLNPFVWTIQFPGPLSSPYEGGKFVVESTFSDKYPYEPPKIRFLTKVYHPLINKENGEICPLLYQKDWKPAKTLGYPLSLIMASLANPKGEAPVEAEIAQQLLENRMKFEAVAKEWTQKFAS